VVDTHSACGMVGLVALAGAAAARAGGDIDAVSARVQSAVDVAKIWFAVDTLEFLRRGGRIGTAQAWLGGALKIKPILTVDGEITPIERVRTSGRAFERMVDFLRARHDDGYDAWVVQHIQAPDQAAALAERGREIFGCEPAFVSEIGPVIGTHVGPGLLGVGGIPRSLLD
jgi:DegV family protein with EDD domain